MTRLGNSFLPSRGGGGQTASFHCPLPKYSRCREEFPPWRWAGLQGSVNSQGIRAGILPGASALERLRGQRGWGMGTAGGSGDTGQLRGLREAAARRGFSEPCSGLGAQPRALPSSREMLQGGRREWDGLEALGAAAASPELPGMLLSLECSPVIRQRLCGFSRAPSGFLGSCYPWNAPRSFGRCTRRGGGDLLELSGFPERSEQLWGGMDVCANRLIYGLLQAMHTIPSWKSG